MTVPTPPIKLEGHCSVIHNNIFYAYSPQGFLSLPLHEIPHHGNGNWTRLDPGEKVSGAACLTGGIEGNESDEALYVVGGTGAASADYLGLQRYSFKDQKWETLNAYGGAVNNLQGHGAAYVKSNSTIVVYGGSTVGAATASTYLISTISPYVTNSLPPQAAPLAFEPTLIPWSDTQVALMGGSSDPTIYLYSDSTGWNSSGATLPGSVEPHVQYALVDFQKDKIVEEFDLSVDPNTVNSYLVLNNGNPVSPATEVGASSGKRSVSDYPAYNGAFSPTQKRSDFSLAQGKNGLVVISGGQGDHSLAIFNSTSNAWVNSTELFYGNSQHALKADTTSTSTTPTATSSPTATDSHTSSPTPAAGSSGGSSGGSSDNHKTILGATLGSVCGFALILLAILFFLRRQKKKRKQVGQAAGGDSKDRLSFQDQGIEPLTEGAYPMAKSTVPVATASNDSLAIMSGRATGEKSLKPTPASAGYGLSKPSKSSPLSTIPSSGLAPSSMYSENSETSPTATHSTAPGNKPGDRTTDEGWAKYFDDNNGTNLAGMQADRSTSSSVYTKSDYRGSAWPMKNLTPLNFGFLDQPKPLGRVVSGSPTTENASSRRSLAIPEGQSAHISSADSESIASNDDPHDTNWTGAGQNSWLGRPTSSNYSNSFYDSSTRDLPATASNSGPGPRASNGRRSSVVIPDDIDELPIQGRGDNFNSDMSWLNLHADR